MARIKKLKIPSKVGKMAKYIPLYQILGELHPTKRQIVLNHIDDNSFQAVCDGVHCILRESMSGKTLGTNLKQKLRGQAKQNRSQFKMFLNPSSSMKLRRRALTDVGGGPLAFLLSSIVPFLLGQIVKRNR